jgi:peptidoglycan/xylan/chitin deacetylase (PgdA/CDA1 family)
MPSRKIFLTFDDGPHPVVTPQVLDVLKMHNVRGTFFLTGSNIRGNEEIVRRIETEGHSIGIHAYHHRRSLAFSKRKTLEEIEQTAHALSSIVRQRIRLFRPPFGFFSGNTIAAANELGFLLVMWSCLTGDFRRWSNDRIVATALRRISHGSILVFHDNDLTRDTITDILNRTIAEIRKKGFDFGAIR